MNRLVRSAFLPSISRSFHSSLVCSNKAINSPNAPAAVGPYSHAVKANGFVFVSGSLGLDPKTGNFPDNEVVAQTRQSMDNISAILKASDSSMDKIVKTTILLADIKDFPKVNEVYASYFKGNFPARATYAVKDLPNAALVEIEAIATHN